VANASDYVQELVSPDGQHYGMWMVNHPASEPKIFTSVEEAVEWAVLIGQAAERVSPDE